MSSIWASAKISPLPTCVAADLMPSSLDPGKGGPRSDGHHEPAAINGDGLKAHEVYKSDSSVSAALTSPRRVKVDSIVDNFGLAGKGSARRSTTSERLTTF
jgi:hypothetical protein